MYRVEIKLAVMCFLFGVQVTLFILGVIFSNNNCTTISLVLGSVVALINLLVRDNNDI